MKRSAHSRRSMRGRRLLGTASVVSLPLLASCARSDTQFSAQFASDFTPAHHTVSVLAVYQDGQISTDAWHAIAVHLVPALGSSRCDFGYAGLIARNDPLTDSIDEYGREGSPIDFLRPLASVAKGDLVLVLKMVGGLSGPDHGGPSSAGWPPTTLPSSLGVPAERSRGPSSAMPGRGSLGVSPAPPAAGRDTIPPGEGGLDISGYFFSVREARLVAVASIQYSGASLDEASAKFAAKVAQALPETTCAGWSFEPSTEPNAEPAPTTL